MENRKKNLVVWLITWAGMLLVILYSPIGSPDLYTTKKYFTPNQGVQFKGVELANIPSLKNRVGNNNRETYMPEFIPANLTNTSYPVTVAEESFNSGSLNIPTQRSGTLNSNQKTANPGSGVDKNVGTLIGRGSNQKNNVPTNGFMALTTNLNTTLTKNTFAASNDYVPDSGGADPGIDPTGPTIPVGEGWGLFILFAGCYLLLKQGIFKLK